MREEERIRREAMMAMGLPEGLQELLASRGSIPGSVGMLSIEAGPDGLKIMGGGDIPDELKEMLMGIPDNILGKNGDDDICFCPSCTIGKLGFTVNKNGAIQVKTTGKGLPQAWTISRNMDQKGPRFLLKGQEPKRVLVTDLGTESQDAVMALVKLTRKYNSEVKRLVELGKEIEKIEAETANLPEILQHEIFEAFRNDLPGHARPSCLTIDEVLPREKETCMEEVEETTNPQENSEVVPEYWCYGEKLSDQAKAKELFDRQKALEKIQENLEGEKVEAKKIEEWLLAKKSHIESLKREAFRILHAWHPDLKADESSIRDIDEGETPSIEIMKDVKKEVDTLPPDIQKIIKGMYMAYPDMFSSEMVEVYGL